MRAFIKKWSNSASVRIPALVMEAAHLDLDQAVDIREEDGRVIVEPIRRPAYDLDVLIAGITEENRHDEADFRATVGKERPWWLQAMFLTLLIWFGSISIRNPVMNRRSIGLPSFCVLPRAMRRQAFCFVARQQHGSRGTRSRSGCQVSR